MLLFVSKEVLIKHNLLFNGNTKRCNVCPLFEPDHPDYKYAATGRRGLGFCSFCSGEGALWGVELGDLKIDGRPKKLHAIIQYPGAPVLILNTIRGNQIKEYTIKEVVEQNPHLVSQTKVEEW